MSGQINESRELLSILLPTRLCPLLVPNVVVAEIIEMSTVRQLDNTPSWQVGMIDWRGKDLPLFLFEGFADTQTQYSVVERPVVAVMNSVTERALPAYALVCCGIPKLITVKPDDIETFEAVNTQIERVRVRVQLEEAIVPSLEYLESKA